MPRNDIIVGLDIGTNGVKAVAMQRKTQDLQPQILGMGFAASMGVRRGMIVDREMVQQSIAESLMRLEKIIERPIKRVFVNIGGNQTTVLNSRGVVAVSRADGEISEEDIARAIQGSQAVSLPPNREIIHVVPKSFTIDGEGGIKDALGMKGIRLEVDTLLVLGYSPFIKSLVKCLSDLDLEIADYVVSPLATAEVVLNKRQKELGVVLLDIGGSTTDLVVFEEGGVIHIAVLPVGSSYITNDIAIGLRTSIDVAEKIKLSHGVSLALNINKRELINLSEISSEEEGEFSKRAIAEIIEARLCEIFELADKELKKIARQNLLPAGVILTGGGSKIPQIVELAKRELKLPCQIGSLQEFSGTVDCDDLSSACAIGLAMWGQQDSSVQRTIALPSLISYSIDKVKGWFKVFLP